MATMEQLTAYQNGRKDERAEIVSRMRKLAADVAQHAQRAPDAVMARYLDKAAAISAFADTLVVREGKP